MSALTDLSAADPADPVGIGLSADQVFDLLASPRRRGVIHYLRGRDGAADLGQLAATVAAWEYDTTVEELSPDQRKRVYTSLQQTHLDKLDDAGVVEYDDEHNRVAPTPAVEELEVYLEVVPDREFPWREYYLALGAVASALAIVAWGNVGPFVAVPDAAVAGLVAAVLTVSATVHAGAERRVRGGNGARPELSSPEDPGEKWR